MVHPVRSQVVLQGAVEGRCVATARMTPCSEVQTHQGAAGSTDPEMQFQPQRLAAPGASGLRSQPVSYLPPLTSGARGNSRTGLTETGERVLWV